MIEPTIDTLLDAVIRELEEEVLTKLEGEETRRQLKAALVILRRVSSVWDKVYPTLDADNFDLETTLRMLMPSLESLDMEPSSLRAILDEQEITTADTTYGSMRARNRALQELVIDIQNRMVGAKATPERYVIERELRGLHSRTTARERTLSRR